MHFEIKGTLYSLNIQFCKCLLAPIRIIELGYWPVTPARPFLAITHSFMDWMETLLLECQVCVQDFASAVEMIVKEKFTEVSYGCVAMYIRSISYYVASYLICCLSPLHRCHAVSILF